MTQEKMPHGVSRLNASQRSERAKLAANARWSKTRDRTAATEPMRAGQLAKFEREVDPNSELPVDERRKLARNAQQAHLARMRYLALRAKADRAIEAAKSVERAE